MCICSSQGLRGGAHEQAEPSSYSGQAQHEAYISQQWPACPPAENTQLTADAAVQGLVVGHQQMGCGPRGAIFVLN